MGRINKYAEAVEPRLEDIREWSRLMTEKQITERLGVAVTTWERYKKAHPELRQALQSGREKLREDCMSALIKKALGHKEKVQKVTVRQVDGRTTRVIYEDESYYPPDTGALHLLLKNIDSSWHNDDAAILKMKQKELELQERKLETSEW